MSDSPHAPLDGATRIAAGDDGSNYDGYAIVLHWVTAVLVLCNFVLAHIWDWFAKPTRGLMEATHMSFGVLLAVVIVTRIIWRFMPGHQMAPLEQGRMRFAAKAGHYLLYAMLVAEAVLGFAFRWGAGRPMSFFGLGIPPLIAEMTRPERHQLRELHENLGWAIIAVALLHALAALYHHYVLKDRVLERMLPSLAR